MKHITKLGNNRYIHLDSYGEYRSSISKLLMTTFVLAIAGMTAAAMVGIDITRHQPTYSTSNQMNTYVALTADASGRYCHVYGTANTWPNYIDQLEELGCEVVENQTDDYDIQELGTIDDELGVVPIQQTINIH
jgi:hypothetical protein